LPANFRPDRIISAYLTGSNVVTSIGGYGYGGGQYNAWFAEGQASYTPGYPLSATLKIIPYQQLIEMQYNSAVTGQPQFISFDNGVVSSTTGGIFPQPDQDYTGNLLWWQPFNSWVEGQAFALPKMSAGSISSIPIYGGGSIYDVAPTVTFDSGNGAATAVVSQGALIGFAGVSGSGYGSAVPNVLLNGVVATPQTLILPDDYLRKILGWGVPPDLQKTEEQNPYAIKLQEMYEKWVATITNAGSLGSREILAIGRSR